jgi:hypothetical protein
VIAVHVGDLDVSFEDGCFDGHETLGSGITARMVQKARSGYRYMSADGRGE